MKPATIDDRHEVPLGSRYLLAERLGAGTFGEVRRGVVRETGYPVAVKLLRNEFVRDPTVVARFVQEKQVLCRLHHPNLVEVQDLVVEGDVLAIVMDFVPGGDLRSQLISVSRRPAESARLVAQVLDGLAAVHGAGILHRDLKPENVLLDRAKPWEPLARITDFGIAKLTEGPALTQTTALVGTPEYLAPEIADGATATVAADLYAVGIILYELLAGRTPFAGGHPMAVLRRHLTEAPTRPEGISDGLWALLAQLLAKDPHDRPSSADESAFRLRALTGSLDQWIAIRTEPLEQAQPAETGQATIVLSSDSSFANTAPVSPPGALPDRRTGAAPAGVAPRHWMRRRWKPVLALGVILAIVAGATAVVLGLRAGTAPRAETARFDPVRVGDLLVTRQWQLTATTLRATLHVLDVGTSGADQALEEVVAKQAAASAAQIHFNQQTTVVQNDPVVRYELGRMQTAQSRDLSYEFEYTGPSTLTELVADEKAAVAARAAATVPSPSPTPAATPTSSPAPTATSAPAPLRTAVPTAPPAPPPPTPTPLPYRLVNGGALDTSFEDGSNDGWIPFETGTNFAVYQKPGYAEDGHWYLETNTPAPGGSVYRDLAYAPSGAVSYRLTAWVRTPANYTFYGELTLWALDCPGGNESGRASFTASSAGWTLVTADASFTSGCKSLRTQVYEGTTSDDLDIDNVSLSEYP